MSLSARQQLFVGEYLVDLNGKQAASRAGYSAKTAEVQASRLLRKAKVQAAIEEAMQAQRERLQVDTDTVVREFARIAFANIRDYVPRQGETFDPRRLNSDLTAAIQSVKQQEIVDERTGEISRRMHLKLYDKIRALDALARHLGLWTSRHITEASIERRVKAMTPAERLARIEELRAKARNLYLPLYKQQQQLATGRPTIDWTAADPTEAANDIAVVEQVDELLQRADHAAPSRRLIWMPSASLGEP